FDSAVVPSAVDSKLEQRVANDLVLDVGYTVRLFGLGVTDPKPRPKSLVYCNVNKLVYRCTQYRTAITAIIGSQVAAATYKAEAHGRFADDHINPTEGPSSLLLGRRDSAEHADGRGRQRDFRMNQNRAANVGVFRPRRTPRKFATPTAPRVSLTPTTSLRRR